MRTGEVAEMENNAILVELSSRGAYNRFALTDQDFNAEYEDKLANGMPAPNNTEQTYPLTPALDLWYMRTEVGNHVWNNFFTNLTLDLTDIELDGEFEVFVCEEDTSEELLTFIPPRPVLYEAITSDLF